MSCPGNNLDEITALCVSYLLNLLFNTIFELFDKIEYYKYQNGF
jgi:hypothetical protein